MDLSTILTTFVTTLLSGGGVASFMQYKQNKKAKELENDGKASEQWRALYEEQSRITQNLREKLQEVREELATEKRQTLLCRFYICEKLDCTQREPPHADILKQFKTQE